MALSNAQEKFLRGRGHALKPVIMVGEGGLSEALLAEFDSTISHHELIKVRVKVGDREARAAVIEALCKHAGADLVQRIGNMALLYRENPDKKNKLLLPNR
ncbi:MAG: ribosome assembly RNA-binding protein YhbY [Pseudomonadota bacterium]